MTSVIFSDDSFESFDYLFENLVEVVFISFAHRQVFVIISMPLIKKLEHNFLRITILQLVCLVFVLPFGIRRIWISRVMTLLESRQR